jgi:hypothetical protein
MPIIKPIIYNPDGNIYAILGACQNALKDRRPNSYEAFKNETTKAMREGQTDYNGMLRICMKYVDIRVISEEDTDFIDEMLG